MGQILGGKKKPLFELDSLVWQDISWVACEVCDTGNVSNISYAPSRWSQCSQNVHVRPVRRPQNRRTCTARDSLYGRVLLEQKKIHFVNNQNPILESATRVIPSQNPQKTLALTLETTFERGRLFFGTFFCSHRQLTTSESI